MMELVDFDNFPRPEAAIQRTYGGLSGNKEHILINGENYFLKYPKHINTAKMTNVNISYSNAPLAEFIGSQIYKILDIPVHETILGYSKKYKKTVVACKDFLNEGDSLSEFREIKVSSSPDYSNDENSESDGNGLILDDVLSVIRSNRLINTVAGVEKRFWKMFIVDAFIGNVDRNNGNWGIIRHSNGTNEISPVYDNGNSFNNKWSDEKFNKHLNDHNKLLDEGYKAIICTFKKVKNGKEYYLNPFHVIDSMKYQMLNQSVLEIVPKIEKNINKMLDLINEIPERVDDISVISDVQRKFYLELLKIRLNHALIPSLKKVKGNTIENLNL